ncbi:RNB domain-containing ribonuclease, partial [Acinetobacter baumannii]
SLHENVDRACLAAHIWLDADGNKLRQRFVRGLMRSFGSLTYGEVQEAIDGRPNERCALLMDSVIRPLYGAYASLAKARDRCAPLDLDL